MLSQLEVTNSLPSGAKANIQVSFAFAFQIPRSSAGPSATWLVVFLSRAGQAVKRLCRRPPCPAWHRKESPSRWKARPRMSSSSRRFEILLPLRFNDGQAVSDPDHYFLVRGSNELQFILPPKLPLHSI